MQGLIANNALSIEVIRLWQDSYTETGSDPNKTFSTFSMLLGVWNFITCRESSANEGHQETFSWNMKFCSQGRNFELERFRDAEPIHTILIHAKIGTFCEGTTELCVCFTGSRKSCILLINYIGEFLVYSELLKEWKEIRWAVLYTKLKTITNWHNFLRSKCYRADNIFEKYPRIVVCTFSSNTADYWTFLAFQSRISES